MRDDIRGTAEQLERAELRKAIGEARKFKAEAMKADVERRQLEIQISAPWFKKKAFYQAAVAGLVEVPLLAYYFFQFALPMFQAELAHSKADVALAKAEVAQATAALAEKSLAATRMERQTYQNALTQGDLVKELQAEAQALKERSDTLMNQLGQQIALLEQTKTEKERLRTEHASLGQIYSALAQTNDSEESARVSYQRRASELEAAVATKDQEINRLSEQLVAAQEAVEEVELRTRDSDTLRAALDKEWSLRSSLAYVREVLRSEKYDQDSLLESTTLLSRTTGIPASGLARGPLEVVSPQFDELRKDFAKWVNWKRESDARAMQSYLDIEEMDLTEKENRYRRCIARGRSPVKCAQEIM